MKTDPRIYDYVGGQLLKVVAVGDAVISGKTITGLKFSRTGLWGDPIAFQATFEDGSKGIYTIDVISPSAPRITRLEKVGNDLHLSFTSVAGRSYVIQTCIDLSSGSWSDLSGGPIVGTGNIVQRTVSFAPGEPNKFYRLKQLP